MMKITGPNKHVFACSTDRENPHPYKPNIISFPDWHREPEPWVPLTGLVYYPVENPLSGRSFGGIQISRLSEIRSTPTLGIAYVVEDHLYKLKSCGRDFFDKLGSNCSDENQPFLAWAVHETTQFFNLTASILYPTHVIIHSSSRGIAFLMPYFRW